jgi:hypothetical protein
MKDLWMLFEQMAQSFLKMLAPQKLTTNTTSSSTNAQATTALDLLIIQTPHKPWNTPRTSIMQR